MTGPLNIMLMGDPLQSFLIQETLIRILHPLEFREEPATLLQLNVAAFFFVSIKVILDF